MRVRLRINLGLLKLGLYLGDGNAEDPLDHFTWIWIRWKYTAYYYCKHEKCKYIGATNAS